MKGWVISAIVAIQLIIVVPWSYAHVDVTACEEQWKSNHNDNNAIDCLIKAYVEGKKYDEIILILEKTLASNPDHGANTYYKLALVYEFKHDFNKAIENYKDATRLNTKHVKAWNGLGRSYLKSGRTSEARAALATASSLDPDLKEVQNLLALLQSPNNNAASITTPSKQSSGDNPFNLRQEECKVKIYQEDKEIIPRFEDKVYVYRLKPDNLRIAVEGSDCTPGIFPLADSGHIAYLLQTPLIFTSMGFGIAESSATVDVLGDSLRGPEVPKATVEEVINIATRDVEWAKTEYSHICTELKYCPTPAKPYARYLPFSKKQYADFKRWATSSPLSAVAGLKQSFVVYTHSGCISKPMSNFCTFLLQKPHIIVLEFEQ